MQLPNMIEAKIRTNNEVEYVKHNNKDNLIYSGKKYHIKTYGCQMNVHDSEEVAARLESLGFEKTDDYTKSDIVILNTCAIRENAHDKVFGFLGRCKHLKKEKPDLIVGICGCMAQEEHVTEEILKKYPYVNIVFGTHNIHELNTMLEDAIDKQNISVYSYEGKVFENIPYKRDSTIKAWVNIQYGCDKFCTYCIVPYTRGKQRSRKSDEIIKEVEKLKENGYLEVTLLGQNVNAYGKDLESEISFADLLEKVAKIGIPRIRFVTSHPWDFTDETINTIAKYNNIMPHIHLPLQSGSSKILKLMGRSYTKDEYLKLFNKIKKTIPNVAITTDIIVAFPGENELDFSHTLDVVNECAFDSAFTFIFSPRVGTPAAKLENNIPEEEKNKRLQELNKLINNYSLKNNQRHLNKEVKVLVEGISDKNNENVYGYSEDMKLVNLKGSKELIGKIVNVNITDAKSFSLYGKIKD